MIEIELSIEALQAEWRQCDGIANYVANMISHNRSDSIRYANLFSSALNELMEIAFRASRRLDGRVVCRILRCDGIERVTLTFPCAAADRWIYEASVARAGAEDAETQYLSILAGDLAPVHQEVLSAMVIECHARLTLESMDAEALTLVADLPLERLVS
ncbi:ubiquinone biosynthesis methyltransferase UbiE [Ancylobacter sp. 6x-1]|uniref:Ubiquinone biosynthesis methyltransferase UbiE n=1 Tax=Ancylobacter crimeensis TaxID=2579147 RepID=A0ABT0D770_9HYPH|nr:ubiquinone biosynthesis methyltransferase UbiE [Ancylobacter crimeensis]MCK0195791.1 ubiquinone biosynthesis methyltransferase UbiE [Ancylobacter crimeensis]